MCVVIITFPFFLLYFQSDDNSAKEWSEFLISTHVYFVSRSVEFELVSEMINSSAKTNKNDLRG